MNTSNDTHAFDTLNFDSPHPNDDDYDSENNPHYFENDDHEDPDDHDDVYDDQDIQPVTQWWKRIPRYVYVTVSCCALALALAIGYNVSNTVSADNAQQDAYVAGSKLVDEYVGLYKSFPRGETLNMRSQFEHPENLYNYQLGKLYGELLNISVADKQNRETNLNNITLTIKKDKSYQFRDNSTGEIVLDSQKR